MQNLSDKELDELIKKASEAQTYSYEAESWPALAYKLDAQPKRGFTTWRNLGLMVVGLVLMGSLVLLIPDDKESLTQARTEQISIQEKISERPSTNERSTSLTNNSSQSRQSTIGSYPKIKGDDANETSQVNKVDEVLAVDKDQRIIRSMEERHNDLSRQVDDREEKKSKRSQAPTPSIAPLADSIKKEMEQRETIKAGAESSSSPEEERQSKKMGNRFAIKISVSPDFSSESFSKADAAGWNYGGSIEYQLAKSFSISVGLLNSRKYYTAEDVSYGKYTAEFAEGDCRMWDIPVNIQYYLPTKRSVQLLTTVGFSSYIMKQENYIYYPDETDRNRKYYSEINNENTEWFKILNLSMAAQVRIRTSLFLQVEPFVKIPLAGLGEGNIALTSFGTFLTLKYQLFTKPTDHHATE